MDVGGGLQHWARQRKKEYLEGNREGVVIRRVMKWKRKAVTNYCRLRGGKGIIRGWWDEKAGQMEDATCPSCRDEDDTPDHIVFRCQMIKTVKDVEGRGKRKWATEDELGQLGRTSIEEMGEEKEHWASR